jgi:ribosome-associated protein
MDSKKLALLCRELADNRKAENIVVLDVSKLSSVTDYFVIASGTSQPHLRAITDEINSRLRDDHDLRPMRTDGMAAGSWVVMDFFDVIVHVMHADTRKHYDLESLWGDAKVVLPAKLKVAKTKSPIKTATKAPAKTAVKKTAPKKKKTPAKG